MSQFFEQVKNKSKDILIINFLVFVPMWSIFLINNYLLGNALNSFGISPREVSFFNLISIMSSWLLHANYAHIIGNTSVLFPLLFMVCLLERQPIKHVGALIFLSGAFTWLLGMTNSVHVGASGLIFALFGYILSSLVIGKNFLYLIPVGLVAYFYSQSILHGLIPQEGVSLAGHLGGLIGGIVLGALIHRKQEQSYSRVYKKTLKEQWDGFVWDIKYKFKKK